MVCYNITAYNEIMNFTVSKREVYNSKLRAGIKAERGMVMKGKNLERAVILGLLLSTGVYGTAWAAYEISNDGNTITFDSGVKTVGSSVSKDSYDGNKPLNNFKNIIITSNNEHGLDLQTNRVDFSNSNITVTVNSNKTNIDGIRLYNNVPNFVVNNFTAYVHSKMGDAINIDDGSTANSSDGAPYVHVKGDLYAEVDNGHGIRANAPTKYVYESNNPYENIITVDGSTTIKIYANASITVKNPTAVWAGADASYNDRLPDGLLGVNKMTKGKGIVQLNGKAMLYLNGSGNYGVWAGKNGEITANDLEIIAIGKDSFGVAATNGNITYDSDDSENKFNSTVILNGINNKVTMNGENSKAIYADSQYGVVQSGENGIGNIDVIGDIFADDNGKIDLAIRDWGDITGNIEATNGATIKLGMAENTSDISLMSEKEGAINIKGNVQAANGATINLSLGDSAYFEGRVDDYKDAGDGTDNTWDNQEHQNVFDKEFAKDVTSSGSVNLTLGNNATWSVTEQSWATTVNTDKSIIDLTNGNKKNYAVHIGTLKGKAKFIVNLDPNTDAVENNGNMIYVYNGTEAKDLNLQINNEREVLTGLANGEKLRFATVANAGHGFGDTYVARGRGVINSGFSIEYEKYNTNNEKENDKYNGGTDFDKTKPGSDYVDGIYGNGENIYLVRDTSKDAGKSDSGATIINMSRANYKNAIYMDRLNKRMGEMRYVNSEEEQGLWVRLRHDRIGQNGDFRSMNTMYEVGYDVKQPTDNGEHRIGMAIDYMRGSTTYDDIMGKGETKRYGLWLYDTWLGEKGHYTDYIVKWGHLSNDFDIRDKDSLENITGDYSNNVFSVSAEYGKKNDMGNNWYFEPQAQLQLARVTGADYVTTQGSKVNVDGINSLIGRAGFRIGRDMDENSTVYLKADLLHEFMGDQTVTAADATGTLREEFENKGTWYDVGFGFATKMSKNSYAFMDFEKSFGNDNDETYQINAGMQWTF